MNRLRWLVLTLLFTLFLSSTTTGFTPQTASAASTKVTSISMSTPSNPLYFKQTVQLKPTVAVTPKGASVKVTYTSTNPKVATVNSKGLVTAIGAGQAIIKASAGTKSTQILVQVKSKVKQLSITVPKAQIAVGETTKLTTTLVMDHVLLTNSALAYDVKDPSIAFLDNTGTLTALKEGTTEVVVKTEEKSAKIMISVSDLNWSIEGDSKQDDHFTWSKDGKYVAINGSIYNANDGKLIRKMEGSDIVWIQNILYKLDKDKKITAYDTNFKPISVTDLSGTSWRDYSYFLNKYQYGLSPEGSKLYYITDSDVTVIDLTTGEREEKYSRTGLNDTNTRKMALSNDGKKLAVTYLWSPTLINTTTGEKTDFPSSWSDPVFSVDGQYIAAKVDKEIEFWDTDSVSLVEEIRGEYNDIGFSPDGRFFATSNKNGNVEVYNAKTFKLEKTLITKQNKQAQKSNEELKIPVNVTFSPNSKQLVVTYGDYFGENGVILSWNISQF